MRGNSGKNISLSGIAKHLVHRWIPLKPTPMFECELTAVFLCTISFWRFRKRTESCCSIYYILRCKDTAIWAKYKTFPVFSAKIQSYLWPTSKISVFFRASSNLMGLILCMCFVVSFPYYVMNVEVSHGYFFSL